ncbi:hypothetical protein I5535_18925 [Rhodobacteraceae bacterium F11138]|nr:hypothetical protein [Rhodobacteraceae bacterium F11138]
MVRFLMIAGLLFGLFSTQADARTIRYEFDVVGSEIGYRHLDKWSEPGQDTSISPEELAAVTAALHPLGSALDQTGSVVLEVSEVAGQYGEIGDLSCVSGFLCQTDAIWGSVYNYMPILGFSGFMMGFSYDPMSSHNWTMGGDLEFLDDGSWLGSGSYNGTVYNWMVPQANFTLANFNATEIAPVPLPAAAPLLAMGLFALGIGARRRSRAA